MQIDCQWRALSAHAARLIDAPLRELIAADAGRSEALALRVGPI
jgi:hypothetical protein